MSDNEIHYDANLSIFYIQKKIGQNMTFACRCNEPLDNVTWIAFPRQAIDFEGRYNVFYDAKGYMFHLRDLKTTDSGGYVCRDRSTKQTFVPGEPDWVYVFVHNSSVFVKQYPLKWENLTENVVIPCPANVWPLKHEKLKLFADDVEWPNMGSYYSPTEGFRVPDKYRKWSHLNKKRFRCQYENDSTEVLMKMSKTYENYEENLIMEKLIDRLDEKDGLSDFANFTKFRTNTSKDCERLTQFATEPSRSINSTLPSKKLIEEKKTVSLFETLLITSLLILICGTFFIIKRRIKTTKRKEQAEKDEDDRCSEELAKLITAKGKYDKRRVGGGTFGEVFQLIGHLPPAAIKYLNSTDHQQMLKFQEEFEFLKKLNHPNIVCLIETEIDEGTMKFGIIMEFCEQGSLKDLLFDPRMIYTMSSVLSWAKQLFDALAHMFGVHKLIHRDIKPENIFVTKGFVLKLGDFGLAKFIDETCSAATFAGTQRYMSPPQPNHGKQTEMNTLKNSHRNDVYGLGLVLWEIIERRTVFTEYGTKGSFNRDGFISDIIHKKLNKLSAPRCQLEIQQLVEWCTNFDRFSRPMANEVHIALKAIDLNLFDWLSLLPITEIDQRKLFRPIGFDGTDDRIANDETFSSDESFSLNDLNSSTTLGNV
ncbi:unnamed protein product, partial [Mesorhabditis belari]|uniref:Mitogen-activated protein kinase kinase kinase n=1 Tax=Mesorhabditis belari TaxID=2138241 RepID=A0AAF3EEA8_9BILA